MYFKYAYSDRVVNEEPTPSSSRLSQAASRQLVKYFLTKGWLGREGPFHPRDCIDGVFPIPDHRDGLRD